MSGTHPTPADPTPAASASEGRPTLRLLPAPGPVPEHTAAEVAEQARATARSLHPAARRAPVAAPAPVRSVPRPVAI